MMGVHHAASGAAAWMALSTTLRIDASAVHEHHVWFPAELNLGLGLLDVSPATVVLGMLITAGAALLPDADHAQATIAQTIKPVTQPLCATTGALMGGHRHGTHSILGIVLLTALVSLAPLAPTITLGGITVAWLPALVTWFLVAIAVRSLEFLPDRLQHAPWLCGTVAGVFAALHGAEITAYLPVAIPLGAIVHCLGDMLTVGGVNWLWPLTVRPPKALAAIPVVNWVWKPNGYVAFPVLGRTGSMREALMCVPLSLYTVYAISAGAVAPAILEMLR